MVRALRAVFWLPGALAEFVVRNQSLVLVLVALVAASVMAGVTGHWLFYRGAYVIGGLIVLCFAWARIHVRGLDVGVERAEERLQVGQETETRLRLKSSSMFTKLWLEVEDETDMPGRPSKTVITLPANSTRNWKISNRCTRRGMYQVGPVKVTTGDPFGLFRFTRHYGDRQPVLVLPRAEELPYFWAPAAQLPGEGVVHKRTHYVTPNASGVREYYPGDSYNRIHWKSTARLGRLMVKTFEMDPTSHAWVVLDLHRRAQAGTDDESTEEYGVRIAAALAFHFLQHNRVFGLLMEGSEREVFEPSRGPGQYMRILESLATAQGTGATPLAALLEEEGRRMGRHSTVIIVTASVDDEWLTALSLLLQQGARAAVVLMDARSFDAGKDRSAPTRGDDRLDELAAMGVVTYQVRAGADISLVLGPSGIVGDSGRERRPAAAVGAR
jgi:uncharacterized protein (DUF58 family)